jgi:hypothetical protein
MKVHAKGQEVKEWSIVAVMLAIVVQHDKKQQPFIRFSFACTTK